MPLFPASTVRPPSLLRTHPAPPLRDAPAPAACLAAFCLTSQTNRALALDRDTMDVLVANMRMHMEVAPVVVGVTQTLVQLMRSPVAEHSKQFTRAVVDSVLEGRRWHPGHPLVHMWTLTFLHRVSSLSDDHRVYVTRHPDGLPLLLEARGAVLTNSLPLSQGVKANRAGGAGQCITALALEAFPAVLPTY